MPDKADKVRSLAVTSLKLPIPLLIEPNVDAKTTLLPASLTKPSMVNEPKRAEISTLPLILLTAVPPGVVKLVNVNADESFTLISLFVFEACKSLTVTCKALVEPMPFNADNVAF